MNLPINGLLYLLSTGLLAGSGLLFYQTVKAPKPKSPQEIHTDAVTAINRGKGLEPKGQEEIYGPPHQNWWRQLKEINLTGKLPPPPPDEEDPKKPKVEEKPVIPVNDLLTLIVIVAAGDDTRIGVRYKPTANVVPPANAISEPSPVSQPTKPFTGPSDTVVGGPTPVPAQPLPAAGSLPAAAGNRPGGPGVRPGIPTAPAALDPNAKLFHWVSLNGTLWPPFENIRFVGFGDRLESALFEREDAKVEKEKWTRDEVFKIGLVEPEVLKQLLRGDGTGTSLQVNAPGSTDRAPGTNNSVAGSANWRDPGPETRELERGNYFVSEPDHGYLETNMQKVLENQPLRDYQSPKGNIRGVMTGKVTDPVLKRMGLQEGDVLIRLNTQPTPTRAEAIKLARDQYQSGVRDFVGEIMREGRMITQTLTLKR